MERSINFIDLKSVLLTSDYVFSEFNCGNEDLNEFLLKDSKMYLRNLRYATTLLKKDNRIIAYYSLANDLLTIHDVEDFSDEIENDKNTFIEHDYWETFLAQKNYPAIKIGRLAVDAEFQNKGIGSLIVDSLIGSYRKNNKAGCQFITVDAINNQNTLRFYEVRGFKFLTALDVAEKSRAMYRSLVNCKM